MYKSVAKSTVQRGNFFQLFSKWERLKRYILGILIGLPTWFVIGILVSFSDKFAKEFGITEAVDPGRSLMYAYAGIALGDVAIGFVSQALRSRKQALYIFYALTAGFMLLFFTVVPKGDAQTMYWVCAGLGFATGFWAIFVTMAAEQFGTNLRATAATTIPNMVRGMLTIAILPLFKLLRDETDYVTGGWLTGAIILTITVIAALLTKETFGRDLDFLEEDSPLSDGQEAVFEK